MSIGSDNILDTLRPEVLSYAGANYLLRNDLDMLHRVYAAGAPEATIFYSARILEVLAADALKRAGLPVSSTPLPNLATLADFNLIPTTTRYWAHALRRLGNDVRHILRPVIATDAEQAIVFVERWLSWFFCRFELGHGLDCVTTDGRPLLAGKMGDSLRAFMSQCDDQSVGPDALAQQMSPAGGTGDASLLITPVVPAVLVEMLLGRGERERALGVLNGALSRFPDDLRLLQLKGLYHSRQAGSGKLNDAERAGHLDSALKILEPLYPRFRTEPEMAGILAAVYKRIADRSGESAKWLKKSHQTYDTGWRDSKQTNAYLGINAATTALLLGRRPESRRLAGEVRELLQTRFAALAKLHPGKPIRPSYWDQVTLAEARLLAGDLDAARQLYQQAFNEHVDHPGDIDVSRRQVESILKLMEFPGTSETFLIGNLTSLAGKADRTFAVLGASGVAHSDGVVTELRDRLAKQSHGSTRFAFVSSLLQPIERTIAHSILNDPANVQLRVVLPRELPDVLNSLPDESDRNKFRTLLGQAASIRIVESPTQPRAGRDDCGEPAAEIQSTLSSFDLALIKEADVVVLLSSDDSASAIEREATKMKKEIVRLDKPI